MAKLPSRSIFCPLPGCEDAWLKLPAVFTDEHRAKIDEVARVAVARGVPFWPDACLSAALCLAEDWGGIRGLEGRNPEKWDLRQSSLVELNWIIFTVFEALGREVRADLGGSEGRAHGLS